MRSAISTIVYDNGQLKYCLLFFLCVAGITVSSAQTFSKKGGPLYDYYGYYYRQGFDIEVSGLPRVAGNTFGLESVSLNIHHARVSDLKITLQSPGGASIWLSNRNGKDTGSNYINTRFSQFGQDGLISAAVAPFTGIYRPDGQLEFLNAAQDPNGTWRLFIEDLKEGVEGVIDSISLTFGTRPAYAVTASKCDMEHISLCKCANGKDTGELLPDLVIIPFFTENQIKEYAWNDPVYPGQLRLAASIANIGYGPMEIMGIKENAGGTKDINDKNADRLKVKQRIFKKQKDVLLFKDYDAGTMYFENKPGHNHYHVDDWVAFRLIKKEGKRRIIVSQGQKVSYCLFTTGILYTSDNFSVINGKHYGETMPNYGLGNYPDCNFDRQGISVGGYDTYGMLYEGQYLNLPKGLKNGEYTLEVEIDPHHWYKESNKSNNVFSMQISISKQQQ